MYPFIKESKNYNLILNEIVHKIQNSPLEIYSAYRAAQMQHMYSIAYSR